MNPVATQILDSSNTVTKETNVEAESLGEPAKSGVQINNPTFDLISKLERKLKLKEDEFKTKEQKLAEYEAKIQEMEGFETNPLPYLKKKGYDIERINKLALETLDDEEMDPVSRRFREIEETMKKKDSEWEAKLQEKIAAKEKEIQEREQQYQIEVFKRDLKAHIASKKDEYEFVNTHPDGPELVYDVIFADLQRRADSGEKDLAPMEYDAAAQKVEEYLYKEAEKYLSLNKVRSKFTANKDDLASLLKSEQPKTITPDLAPKSASHPAELSEQERMKLAIEGMKTGKWNI